MNTKKVTITLSCIAACLLSAVHCLAQIRIDTTNPIQFGVYAQGGVNTMRTNGFTQLGNFAKPSVPFQNGSGDVVTFGGVLSAPFSSVMKATPLTAALHLGLRFGYNVFRTNLFAYEPTTFIVEGAPRSGTIQYQLDARFASFGLEPIIECALPFHERLRLNAGVRAAWVYSAGAIQTESISDPSGVVFIQGTRNRMKYEATVPNYNPIEYAGVFGASYDFPINKRFSLVPEFQYQLPLNNLTDNLAWNASFMRIGMSVRVTLATTKPIVRDTMYQRDTVTKAVPDIIAESITVISSESNLTVNENDDVRYEFVHVKEHYQRNIPKAKPIETAILAFDVYRVSHDSTATKLDTMYCDEIIWNDFHPLLNYVFFEEGSSSLNGKYRQLMPEDTKHFKIYNDQHQMETYYNMMNIIAMGMKNNPHANVTVTGHVSKKELNILKNPGLLAIERAENVARYLTDNWGIDKSRVVISKGGVPKKPSNEKNPEGVEENQRVEITASATEILEPIMLRDTLLASDITLLRIKNTITSKSTILNWSLAGDQDGKVIFNKKGEGRPTEYIDVLLDRSTMRRLRRDENGAIEVVMMINQQGKGEVRSKVSIPIKVRQTEMLKKRNNIAEVDRYILMLFDFGKDNLTPQNEKLVRFIQQRIEPDAQIGIIGTTDRIGRLDYNIKLSQRRANSVGALFPGTIIAEGRGPDVENYNNDLPEGRFHARTVRIEVEHPRGFSSR